jgi:pyruvate kinase
VKKTKIVCTLGPASTGAEVLDRMIRSGMDVARLNFSHGTHDGHRTALELVREVGSRMGREVAVLADLQGPKIRVGKLDNGSLELTPGQKVRIRPAETQQAADMIPTTYEALPADVKAGDSILMDDGLLRLSVDQVDGEDVRCTVEVGGRLTDHKGINLPGVDVSAPALTSKDLNDLEFIAGLDVDFLSLSFVRRPEDVIQARTHLEKAGGTAEVIAKIEKPEAVSALDAILDAADGIMVARGDLGVEMGPEKVPLIQKQAIESANLRGKLVITATQMLESMVHSSFPTRAEASDVANAVLDQTDAVMLSAETATGRHPVLAIRTMARIIEETERSDRFRKLAEIPPVDLTFGSNAVAHAAATAARHLGVAAIVCLTKGGLSPRLVSDYRPQVPVFAFASEQKTCCRLAAYWGVHPVLFQGAPTTEETLRLLDRALLDRGLALKGDSIIVTCALPPLPDSPTNTMKIHRVGETIR